MWGHGGGRNSIIEDKDQDFMKEKDKKLNKKLVMAQRLGRKI